MRKTILESLPDSSDESEPATKRDDVNVKHLEFIESVIDRMARNSFQAKAWCITIIVALFAFYLTRDGGSESWISLTVSLVVIVLFCVIDTYYLYLEQGYRDLYKKVANLDLDNKVTVRDFDMEWPESAKGARNYFATYKSLSVLAFYPVLFTLHLALLFVFLFS